ncbi:hypothetical protein P43SY_002221 [Pythium insidiosum]|uniref:ABC transporter domain-containing protein n=1 Tax=Pythium insidiosum TaxID=114742 RepID=A0AAD5LSL7_PYTIN|nr:hypothetical protein P43SY_002221 [Pythium insidiosum]
MKRLEKKPLVASPSDPRAYGGVYAAPCPAVDVATGNESSVKAVIDFSAARGLWKTVSFAWVDDLLQDGNMRSIQDMESTCRTNIDIDDEELDAAVREAFDGADLPPGRRERGRFRRILSTLHVAIVGPRGAGKSALGHAVTRLSELSSGSVSIDGVDISKIGLHQLRANVSLIECDPLLITGSVRDNLDPRGEWADDELWRAIDIVGMRDVVFALDEPVVENGCNYTANERVLLSIARALLKKSKLVVLDDAVKHLEPTALPRLQRILQDQWKTISVWIITDHADIVQSLDRVVVLDKGQVVETGTPKELLSKSKTPLRRLVDEWKTLRLRK